MSNFDEWYEDNEFRIESKTDARNAYKAGAASRQAEVDCLKVELDAANERALMLLDHKNKMVDKMQGEVDELQKTVSDQLVRIGQLEEWIDKLNGDQQVTIDDLRRAKAECIKFTNRVDELHDNIKL